MSIRSNWFTDKLLSEGANNNLFMYRNRNIKNQMFSVDLGAAHIFNKFTEHSVALGKKNYQEPGTSLTYWDVVMSNEDNKAVEQKWEVVLCNDPPKKQETKVAYDPHPDSKGPPPVKKLSQSSAPETTKPVAKAETQNLNDEGANNMADTNADYV